MAENESLDLANPGGQRWNHVLDSVRKGKSADDVAHKMSRKIPAALRKALKEFAEAGVTLEALLKVRHDPKQLARLVRKCQGHEYAHLFATTANSQGLAGNEEMMSAFVGAVVERVTDQIIQEVGGTEQWNDLRSLHTFFDQVKQRLESDLQRISRKLAVNPGWSPTARPREKEEVTDPTQDLLSMSLIGVGKR
jgi:hypothetical protein